MKKEHSERGEKKSVVKKFQMNYKLFLTLFICRIFHDLNHNIENQALSFMALSIKRVHWPYLNKELLVH